MFFLVLCFFFSVLVSANNHKVGSSTTTKLSNSCVGKEDGSYWIQLLQTAENDYPPIYVKCSNGYIILDYNYDNNLKEYFSSWNFWHYAIAGPNNGDTVNWELWYLPNDINTKYLVSPDCTTCDEQSSWQLYETKTTYWMSGNMFGCWWNVKGFPVCDLDFDTYTCYYCGDSYYTGNVNPIAIDETSPADYYSLTGQCVTSIESSQKKVAETHEDCTSESELEIMKPSIGISGKFCVCAQPGKQKTYEINNDDLATYQQELSNSQSSSSLSASSSSETNEYTSSNHIVELYSKDFEYGTYRIKESGTYQIMEDIVFEFNKGDLNDPFAEGSWWPSSDQSEDYPGAGSYRDPYFLGFFAGITIETNDVIIDLNGHTLKMSDLYYYHQRWFSIIELASQYFLPGQGPGFMGYDPQFANNVIIKNGILGLSSHFGIHGNFNDNLQLLDLKVQNFETHGIQLNGWTNVVISNVDIGPSSRQAYLKAEFGHARVILPRLRSIYQENPDGIMQFANRESMTMNDIADELEAQMKMALDWIETKTDPIYDDDELNTRWQKAKSLFINEDGIPYTSSLTGLFLNLHSASVFTFNLDTDDYSTNAIIENVKIHDLQHSYKEWIRLSYGPEIYVNTFTAPMDALAMIGDDELSYYLIDLNDDFSNAVYKGNALTDSYIAMNKLSDNWNYLGAMMIKNSVTTAWAENQIGFPDEWGFACNVDSMLHSGKGILGFRMDGVRNVKIDGVEIYNLLDQTPLGRTECGEYSGFASNFERQLGGHFRQLEPIQVGFSGNMVLGMSIVSSRDMELKNIDIHDLESETGLVDGIAVWTHCKNISFSENIQLYNLNAGTQVELGTLSFSDRPNKAPESCAFKIQWETSQDDELVEGYNTQDIYYKDVSNWMICNIQGHVGCDGNDQYTTESNSITVDDSLCSSIVQKKNRNINKIIQSTQSDKFYFNLIIIISIMSITTFILITLYKCCNVDINNKMKYKYSLINHRNNTTYGSIQINNNQIV